jgi:putative peptidoglycan lipid II flippase
MTTFVPELSAAWGSGDVARFRDRFGQGLRLVWAGVLPAAAATAIAASPLVGVLLARGSFDAGDASATADVLAPMALGLPGFTAYLFALRGFYAQGDTRTPFVLNVVENALQVTFTVALVPTLDRPGVGLGAAYAAAYSIAAAAALVTLHRRVGGLRVGVLLGATTRVAAAAGAGIAAAVAVRAALPDDLVDGDLVETLVLVGVTAVVFLAAAVALRIDEVRQLLGAVTGRLRRS